MILKQSLVPLLETTHFTLLGDFSLEEGSAIHQMGEAKDNKSVWSKVNMWVQYKPDHIPGGIPQLPGEMIIPIGIGSISFQDGPLDDRVNGIPLSLVLFLAHMRAGLLCLLHGGSDTGMLYASVAEKLRAAIELCGEIEFQGIKLDKEQATLHAALKSVSKTED